MAERYGGAYDGPRHSSYGEGSDAREYGYGRERAFDSGRGYDRGYGAQHYADERARDPRKLVAYEDDRAGDHYRPEHRHASSRYERADDARDAVGSVRHPSDRYGHDYYATSWQYERRDEERYSAWRGGQGRSQAEEHDGAAFRPESSRAQHYRPHEHDWQHAEAVREPASGRAQARPRAGAQMRLVALASDVLPHGQRIAIVDSRDEGVSIGRDRAFSARIRLPGRSRRPVLPTATDAPAATQRCLCRSTMLICSFSATTVTAMTQRGASPTRARSTAPSISPQRPHPMPTPRPRSLRSVSRACRTPRRRAHRSSLHMATGCAAAPPRSRCTSTAAPARWRASDAHWLQTAQTRSSSRRKQSPGTLLLLPVPRQQRQA
ncbi:hypothetical protein FA09DRAFT_160396 [Tilletiopsis washingtonensis]|uniref:Uncharacterized protein n=1 Tax=Tilletiopsis washingtonensis TaxID=58919 RepID=A0A316Z009_9BASI|nr:hypothetical protein FA09DRAFT_160396 [Tilletiopsis washingtonensis]PWN94839.1 hypothetical protein FA09DRAFT_160396 [Tilletiopsis washingtonensis]